MDYIWHYHSPLGDLTMAGDGTALTGLWFDDQKYFAATLGKEYIVKQLPVFRQTSLWLDLYFSGEKPDFMPPIFLKTTAFRKAVAEIMLKIPYGQTMTYGEIAKEIAIQSGKASMSAQAVGGAVGHNPVSIIIPCHRVIGSDGSLTGYAGGIWRKMQLLSLEKASFVQKVSRI